MSLTCNNDCANCYAAERTFRYFCNAHYQYYTCSKDCKNCSMSIFVSINKCKIGGKITYNILNIPKNTTSNFPTNNW